MNPYDRYTPTRARYVLCQRCAAHLPTIVGTLEEETGLCAACADDLLAESAAWESQP